jgi:Family of unknown function (DUF5343)
MADSHPYTSSGPGGIIQVVTHLRKQFPAAVTVDTLKKLGMASGSEGKVLSVLKYVGVIEEDGKKAAKAGAVFAQHEDGAFQKGFGELVKTAYADLFNLHGDGAWALSTPQLISFFRSSDETSALVGQRQAVAFQALAGLAGKAEVPAARVANGAKARASVPKATGTAKVPASKPAAAPPVPAAPSRAYEPPSPAGDVAGRRMPAIHIDVQVHISPDTSAEQIDRIFESMAKHLGSYIN